MDDGTTTPPAPPTEGTDTPRDEGPALKDALEIARRRYVVVAYNPGGSRCCIRADGNAGPAQILTEEQATRATEVFRSAWPSSRVEAIPLPDAISAMDQRMAALRRRLDEVNDRCRAALVVFLAALP